MMVTVKEVSKKFFANTFRFIDDLTVLNDGGECESFKEILF